MRTSWSLWVGPEYYVMGPYRRVRKRLATERKGQHAHGAGDSCGAAAIAVIPVAARTWVSQGMEFSQQLSVEVVALLTP